MNTSTNGRPNLVLLIDSDPATRQSVVPLLVRSGMELVQARDSVAGLEILQRLPERFRLAIISLEMPGLSGTVLIQTLRLFRPDLPIVCLTHRQPVAAGERATQCLDKPVRPELLRAQLEDALGGVGAGQGGGRYAARCGRARQGMLRPLPEPARCRTRGGAGSARRIAGRMVKATAQAVGRSVREDSPSR